MASVQEQRQFALTLLPYAQQMEQQTGIPAAWTIAMAANETGWDLTNPVLFGIKGTSPSGQSGNFRTYEVYNGQRQNITDQFATYNDPGEAFQHLAFEMGTARYRDAPRNDPLAFASYLKKQGWATDPNYAPAIARLAQTTAGYIGQAGGTQMAGDIPQDDPNRVVASTTYVKDNVSYIQETHADGTVTQRHWEGAQGTGATTILGVPVGGEQVPPAGTGNWVDDGTIDTDAKVAAAWEKKQAAAGKETSVSAPPSQQFIVSRDAQGKESWVPNPNYRPDAGKPSRVAASPDEPNIIIMQPDGSMTSVPNPNYQPGRAKPGYQQYGKTVYRINPDTGDLEPYMTIPENAADAQYADLRNQKMRQDLIPPIQKLLADRGAALQYVQGELVAGRMSLGQANAYMGQIDQQAQAALKGTTIFQQQQADIQQKQENQRMGASMLNQRVSSGGSILNGIFQSLQNVMMPKGQGSLGINPTQMVQDALNTFGGGPEAYSFAKGLLMGAGIGQEGVQAAMQGGGMPGGAPAAGVGVPATAPQQDPEAAWRDIQANPQKWGLVSAGGSPPAQSPALQGITGEAVGVAQSPIVGPMVGWPQQASPVGRQSVPRAI